jgi:hypothetical protein
MVEVLVKYSNPACTLIAQKRGACETANKMANFSLKNHQDEDFLTVSIIKSQLHETG